MCSALLLVRTVSEKYWIVGASPARLAHRLSAKRAMSRYIITIMRKLKAVLLRRKAVMWRTTESQGQVLMMRAPVWFDQVRRETAALDALYASNGMGSRHQGNAHSLCGQTGVGIHDIGLEMPLCGFDKQISTYAQMAIGESGLVDWKETRNGISRSICKVASPQHIIHSAVCPISFWVTPRCCWTR